MLLFRWVQGYVFSCMDMFLLRVQIWGYVILYKRHSFVVFFFLLRLYIWKYFSSFICCTEHVFTVKHVLCKSEFCCLLVLMACMCSLYWTLNVRPVCLMYICNTLVDIHHSGCIYLILF
jgi:hypothetical protein